MLEGQHDRLISEIQGRGRSFSQTIIFSISRALTVSELMEPISLELDSTLKTEHVRAAKHPESHTAEEPTGGVQVGPRSPRTTQHYWIV